MGKEANIAPQYIEESGHEHDEDDNFPSRRRGHAKIPKRLTEVYEQQKKDLGKKLTLIVLSHLIRNVPDITIANDPSALVHSQLRTGNQSITGQQYMLKLERVTGCKTSEELPGFFLNSFVQALEKYWNTSGADLHNTDKEGAQIADYCQALARGDRIVGAKINEDQYVQKRGENASLADVVQETCRHFGLTVPEQYQNSLDQASSLNLHTESEARGARIRLRSSKFS